MLSAWGMQTPPFGRSISGWPGSVMLQKRPAAQGAGGVPRDPEVVQVSPCRIRSCGVSARTACCRLCMQVPLLGRSISGRPASVMLQKRPAAQVAGGEPLVPDVLQDAPSGRSPLGTAAATTQSSTQTPLFGRPSSGRPSLKMSHLRHPAQGVAGRPFVPMVLQAAPRGRRPSAGGPCRFRAHLPRPVRPRTLQKSPAPQSTGA